MLLSIAAEWLPRIFSRDYDRRFRPARLKTAALVGMGMTENQGGSDLRTNSTRAQPSADGSFRLYGHKWFMSAPMCDAFLVLAQSPNGLSCFFMPRWTPGGDRNAIQILRLKDKLGNRSNASSEVEFLGAYAQLVGEEGRGIATIIEMGNYTRLDCCIGSSSLMRQAVAQAVHHARHRTAFQKKLIDQPLMTNVLADLALELEAATVLTMWLARAYDEEGETAQIIRRVVTPAAKFWICKRTPFLTYEAMEVLGGSGYIEESIMPRLYREAPVNSIWEGSGNVMCLDVLRAVERTARAAEVLRAELDSAKDPRVKIFADRFEKRITAHDRNDERQARSAGARTCSCVARRITCQARTIQRSRRILCISAGGRWCRCFRPAAAGSRHARDSRARWSGGLELSEHRQHKHYLCDESDRESERAKNWDPHRIDNGVCQPRPEIDRAGRNRSVARMPLCVEDEHQRCKDCEVFNCIGVGEIKALRPRRLRLVTAGRIGHGAHESADYEAIDDIRDPQDTGQNDRQRQPQQFFGHRRSPFLMLCKSRA